MNILCEITAVGGMGTIRGAFGGSVILDDNGDPTYFGDFDVLDLPLLKFSRGLHTGVEDRADAVITLGNKNGHFDKLLGDRWAAGARVVIRIGRGNRWSGYRKLAAARSSSMLFDGTVIAPHGYQRSGDTVELHCTASLFLGSKPVLSETFTDDRFRKIYLPLVIGDYTTFLLGENTGIPATCIDSDVDGAGVWLVGQKPLGDYSEIYLGGEDPDNRGARSSYNRKSLSTFSYEPNGGAGTNLDEGRVDLTEEEEDGDFFPYVPRNILVACKGLKTTLNTPLSRVAHDTFISQLRDILEFWLRYMLSVPLDRIDTAGFNLLRTWKGRRVIRQQVDARVILAEIESDLNIDVVALSGRRSAIGDRVKYSPVRNGRGLALLDWSADRYLVPGSIEFTGEPVPYVNEWTFYSGFNATSDSQLLTDYAKTTTDYGEQGVAGFIEHRVQEQRWLYDEDDADYSSSNKVREHEDWPYRSVRFLTSMDYLDILPTDRVVLEEEDRNLPPVSWHNDRGPSDRVRFTQIETVSVKWPSRQLEISGFKGRRFDKDGTEVEFDE